MTRAGRVPETKPRAEIARWITPQLLLRWITDAGEITVTEMARRRFGPVSKQDSRARHIRKVLLELEEQGKVTHREETVYRSVKGHEMEHTIRFWRRT